MNAIIAQNEVAARHEVCDGREYLKIVVPNGWADVRLMTNKVLVLDGKRFAYSGWNSDKNEAYFVRPAHQVNLRIAKIENA